MSTTRKTELSKSVGKKVKSSDKKISKSEKELDDANVVNEAPVIVPDVAGITWDDDNLIMRFGYRKSNDTYAICSSILLTPDRAQSFLDKLIKTNQEKEVLE